MKVGIQLAFQAHQKHDDREMYRNELRLVIEGEAMGFDRVWPVEHHFTDYAMCPDNMQLLSWIAARTRCIEVGTGAIILPWWEKPLRVVEKMVLLDHLSDGRAILGLGRGLARREYRGFGVDLAEARARFNEAAAIVLRGLETGVVEADTEHYRQERVEVRPRPLKSFKGRRYMVCTSPESFSIAASLGLGAMLFAQTPWEKVAPAIRHYREDYARHNEGMQPPPIQISDTIVCDSNLSRVEELAERHVTAYYLGVVDHYELAGQHFAGLKGSHGHYARISDHLQSHGKHEAIGDYRSANACGDPERILDQLRARRALIGDFECNPVFSFQSMPYEQVERSMRLFAEKVAPELRSWPPANGVSLA